MEPLGSVGIQEGGSSRAYVFRIPPLQHAESPGSRAFEAAGEDKGGGAGPTSDGRHELVYTVLTLLRARIASGHCPARGGRLGKSVPELNKLTEVVTLPNEIGGRPRALAGAACQTPDPAPKLAFRIGRAPGSPTDSKVSRGERRRKLT